MTKAFKIIDKQIAYNGFFRMEKYRLQHTLFAGGWSEEISRELFCRGRCIAVLLYDPAEDKVVLIEQFRAGAIPVPERAWLLEIVAGAVEEGENPDAVAYRESIEEAGCEIQDLMVVNEFYTTPGGSSERITLYCGKIDSKDIGGIHGLDHEHEDIFVTTVSADEAYQMVVDNRIESAIPIIAIQWLMLNKNRLRQQWQN